MLFYPLDGQADERGMEAGVGVAAADFQNIPAVEAKGHCAEGNVDPVGLTERIDKPA